MNDILIRVSKHDRKTIVQLEKVLSSIGVQYNAPVKDDNELIYWAEVDSSQLQKLRDMDWRGQVNIQEKTMKRNEARDVATRHQIKIAKDTMKMSDAGAMIMGGMTKDEARKVLKKAGYSDSQIRAMEESTNKDNIIDIKEETTIGEYVLEPGDRIEVLNESSGRMMDYAEDMVMNVFGGDYEKAFTEVIMGMSDSEVQEAVDYIYRMWT